MHFAFWKSKATNMHLEYVLPTAFPIQHLLRKSVSALRHTYEGESNSKSKIHLTTLIEVTVSNFAYHFST